MKGKANFSFSKLYRTRKKIPINELEMGKCQNCGYEFQGHFCPDCGQEVSEFNRPLGFIMYDFMGNFFAFDTRFFKTFKCLLFYPGFLTKEFFRGRRARYSPPFRIFVFLSFILFLLLSVLTDKGLKTVMDTTVNDSLIVSENIITRAGKEDVLLDKNIVINQKESPSGIHLSQKDSTGIVVDLNGLFLGTGNMRSRLNQLGDTLENKLTNITDPFERQKYQEYIAMCRAPEPAVSSLLKYLSWASFLLLPLFALILKLFYVQRKQLYIQHLIFSIHLHSFLFMILIPATILRLIFNSVPEVVNLILFGTFPIYFTIALRKFYDQPWGKTIVKFIGISMIYNVVMLTVVLLVFLKSLHVF